MRNTIGKLCVIIGTLLLIFAVAFISVSFVLRDSEFIEDEYEKQNVSELMGMSTPDLSAATDALLDYMRGERDNIRFGARVNGADLEDIFYHEKEVVHMAEVQSLWLGLVSFSRYALLVGVVLLTIGAILPDRGKKRVVIGSGVIWGAGIFGGVLVFFGAWAIMNFQSFWTVFHFIIFPGSLFQYLAAGATPAAMNELNWVLSSDSLMVKMLMPIFPGLVMRCAIFVIAEIVLALLIGLLIRFAGSRKVTEAVADIVTVERDTNEPVVVDGPNLVLAHQLQNAPVSKREELKRRAEAGLPLYEEQKRVKEERQEPTIELREDAPDPEPTQAEPDPAKEEPEQPQEPTIELRGEAPDEEPAEEPEEEKEQEE